MGTLVVTGLVLAVEQLGRTQRAGRRRDQLLAELVKDYVGEHVALSRTNARLLQPGS
jgi:hypothetical protein